MWGLGRRSPGNGASQAKKSVASGYGDPGHPGVGHSRKAVIAGGPSDPGVRLSPNGCGGSLFHGSSHPRTGDPGGRQSEPSHLYDTSHARAGDQGGHQTPTGYGDHVYHQGACQARKTVGGGGPGDPGARLSPNGYGESPYHRGSSQPRTGDPGGRQPEPSYHYDTSHPRADDQGRHQSANEYSETLHHQARKTVGSGGVGDHELQGHGATRRTMVSALKPAARGKLLTRVWE